MKFFSVAVSCALLSTTTAFQVARPTSGIAFQQHQYEHQQCSFSSSTSALGMFGGAGAAAPKEDSPEEAAQMEATAKAMGMSVEEYTLAMNARVRLAEKMDSVMVTAGKADTVLVERDLNNPAKKFEVTITEAGKALGKDELSKQLVAALKKAGTEAQTGRAEAQKEMMQFIGEQLKK